ncbi:MAG TPA: ABC transporter ATP-binding protein [Tepidiformaceae bacterium]|nr:ABC transporter ATP-binding protein [Tepidiformaceae bacterium]
MTEPAISLRNLRVVRGGNEVLHNLNLDIEPGVITGLLGPSGCGKTTMMRAIVGVQKVASGQVTVLGQPAGSSSLRAKVGYVTQAPSVYEDLSIEANLHYFARLYGVPTARATAALEAVGLSKHSTKLVRQLSGGQRARASLASALLASPEVLILDEPTVGLDPVLRAELWATFHRLAGDGATLLVSSHVMDEAERCDRLVLMREGAILAHCPPRQLLADTGASTVEDAFLSLVRKPGVAV